MRRVNWRNKIKKMVLFSFFFFSFFFKMDDRKKQIKTLNAAETLLGRQIKVKTVLNEQMEGSIYTLDKMTNCLVLDILLYIYIYIFNNNSYKQMILSLTVTYTVLVLKDQSIVHFVSSKYHI
jgi:small nuclear ribonucleoprotein (snRNP)-like protein